MRGDEFLYIANMTCPVYDTFLGKEVITVFDALASVLTTAALGTQITSYTSIPVVVGVVLAPIAVAIIVVGVRGLKRMSGTK